MHIYTYVIEQYELSHNCKTRLHFYPDDFGESGKKRFYSTVRLWLKLSKSAFAYDFGEQVRVVACNSYGKQVRNSFQEEAVRMKGNG